jgi:hypothetical protein
MVKNIVNCLKAHLHYILKDQTGSFNFGVGYNATAPTFAIQVSYLYLEQAYRKWITQIALAFYTGRQDTFVWLDLQKQFRNPERQQIIPYNLTKEIIDETSILYREEPTYIVKDKKGRTLKKDTDLWKRIRKDSRYHNLCQQLDSMTKLLGTVLVKVSFVDPITGDLVNENKPGVVQFDIVYSGFYSVKYHSSPYYLTQIDFNFSQDSWVNKSYKYTNTEIPVSSGLSVASVPTDTTSISNDTRKVKSIRDLGKLSKITWSLRDHEVCDDQGNKYQTENPYGCIPAVPFFNQDPGNYFFLPVNEPLLYANHAINMRLSDLNHIAKHQSFGQAVVKGIERPVNNRLGRPSDDFNNRGGSRGFGFGFGNDLGPTGLSRNTDSHWGYYQDGNASANQLGFSMGPDMMISVGETGDFKFVSPQADITGLVKTIYTMMDMVRINHGLRPKHDTNVPTSGYGIILEKLGVVEQNKKRAGMFKEREQQLFQIVKKLWNIHHAESKEKFSEDCELEIYYAEPEFAIDPQTKMTTLQQEYDLLAKGDRALIRKIKPHLDDEGIEELIKNYHKDRLEQAQRDVELANYKSKNLMEPEYTKRANKKVRPRITNLAEHARQSSIQPGNGDSRETDKTKRVKDQAQLEADARSKKE